MAKLVEILQDIIDSVIEAVGDDKGSLKQCTLVSSSFLLPSRKQLFFSITIRCEETCQGIHQFLVQNPIIQFSVRAITLKDKFSMWGNESCEWMNGTSLLAILQFPFCCLEHLLIQREKDWDWNSFSSELKDALSNIIHSSNLKTLSLNGITKVPITFFLHIVHLSMLELHSVLPADFDNENSSSLIQAASKGVAPMASHVVVDQCVWHLREDLVYCFEYAQGERFPSFAYFSLIQDREGPTETFLPFMCCLRFFKINIYLSPATRYDFDILSFLMGSLCISLTSPATLEHLEFNISFSGDDNYFYDNGFYHDLQEADVWDHLDSITSHQSGSQLQ